ncbi:MAG: TonB-dependent receptor [Porticoccaceae bacterium]
MRKWRLEGVTLVCGSLVALGHTAFGYAQEAKPLSGGGLEEIIVVAQRRSENLQDVPISIEAIQAEGLDNFNINSAMELPKLVSALNIQESAGSVNLFIRGLGNPATAQGNEASVATYIDGVYYPRLAPELLKLNNVERVEVLKGPQGTLFGRNAVAGLVHIITRDPVEETTVKAEVGYGNYDSVEASLYASTGIAENLATDISVRYEEQFDGYGKVINLPVTHPGYVPNPSAGDDFHLGWNVAVRSKSVYRPSEKTKLILTGDYTKGRDSRAMYSTWVSGTHGPIAVPPFDFIYPPSEDRYDSISDGKDEASNEGWGVAMTLEHELAFADLISVSNYHTLEGIYRADSDRMPIPVFDYEGNFDLDVFTQELRLQSNDDGRLDWTVGLYYMDFQVEYNPARFTGIQWQNNFGLPNGEYQIFTKQDVKSYAAFFQATYEIMPRTNLTLGGRHTTDKVDAKGHNDVVDPVLDVRVNTGDVSDGESFEKLTYRAALDHKLNDNVLLYVSASRGYKSGTYNTLPLAIPAVKPEVLDAYEIGAKTELFANRVRLNLAAFYWDISDLQVQRFDGLGIVLLNAASAESKGVEAELQVSVVDGLDLHGSVTYVDAEYESFQNAPFINPNPNPPGGNVTQIIGGDASGNRPPSAPEVSFNVGFSYRIPSRVGDFLLSANYAYKSKSYFNPDNRVENPSYGLLDGNFSFSPAGYKGLKVTLWGRNLTNDEYILQATQQATPQGTLLAPNAPRTYGIKIGYEY